MIKPVAYKVHERDIHGRPYWFADGTDSVDAVERAINSVKETPLYDVPIKEIIAVLEWYKSEAEAASRAMALENVNAMAAILAVLSLDSGNRANKVLEKLNAA